MKYQEKRLEEIQKKIRKIISNLKEKGINLEEIGLDEFILSESFKNSTKKASEKCVEMEKTLTTTFAGLIKEYFDKFPLENKIEYIIKGTESPVNVIELFRKMTELSLCKVEEIMSETEVLYFNLSKNEKEKFVKEQLTKEEIDELAKKYINKNKGE